MASVHPTSPNRERQCTYRPRFVKARKSTGLDKPAGDTYSSVYAIRADVVESVIHSSSIDKKPSLSEDGIVQNMPSEARVLLIDPSDLSEERISAPDYFAENTGRPNSLGNQSQDNCMLLRRSQRMVPSSIGLGLYCKSDHRLFETKRKNLERKEKT